MKNSVIIIAPTSEQAQDLEATAKACGMDVATKLVARLSELKSGTDVIETYLDLSRKLDALPCLSAWEITTGKICILCDVVNKDHLNLVTGAIDWSAVVAMLIVTHPEYAWTFQGVAGDGAHSDPFWNARKAGPDWGSGLQCTDIFGYSGLRRRIYLASEINDAETNFSSADIAGLAASADEETEFSLILAYALYRSGYAAIPTTSWEQFARLQEEHGHDLECLIEDMNLEFADLPGSLSRDKDVRADSIRNLRLRDEVVGGWQLPTAQGRSRRYVRLLVTSGGTAEFKARRTGGHRNHKPGYIGGEAAGLAANKAYLASKYGESAKVMGKPIQSISWLSEELAKPREKPKDDNGRPRISLGQDSEEPRPHGIPGKRALVAQRLTERSASVISLVPASLHQLVVGAVLANEAMKVAGLRVPTVSMSALRLREVAEVEMESIFYGIEYHASLGRRFDHIQSTVESIGKSYAVSERERSNVSNYQSVIQSLLEVLDRHSRSDEKNECLDELRPFILMQHARRTHWSIRPFAILGARYLTVAMNSAALILLFSALWLAFFCVLAPQFIPGNPVSAMITAAESYLFGPEQFLPEGAVDEPVGTRIYKMVCGVWGLLHTGLLISYVFTAIVRR